MVCSQRKLDYHKIGSKISTSFDTRSPFLDIRNVLVFFLDEIIFRVVQIVFIVLFFQDVMGQNVERISYLLLGHGVI